MVNVSVMENRAALAPVRDDITAAYKINIANHLISPFFRQPKHATYTMPTVCACTHQGVRTYVGCGEQQAHRHENSSRTRSFLSTARRYPGATEPRA